jgi:hypothetical protein
VPPPDQDPGAVAAPDVDVESHPAVGEEQPATMTAWVRRVSAPLVAVRARTLAARTREPGPQPEPQPEPQQPKRRPEPTMGPRAARVFITHIDPWSVMKQAFLLSLALAVILLIASATLWYALDAAGVLEAITRTAADVGGDSGIGVTNFLTFGRVMGVAMVIAGVETVLVTALATLFAFLYNLAVGIGGGLEVTLAEED